MIRSGNLDRNFQRKLELCYDIVNIKAMFQMTIMMKSLSFDRFKIKVENPELFCQSQWEKPGEFQAIKIVCPHSLLGVTSAWFIVYKVLVTILLLSATSTHISHHLQMLGWKWLIFLTHQGLALLILHHVLHLTASLR